MDSASLVTRIIDARMTFKLQSFPAMIYICVIAHVVGEITYQPFETLD